MNTAVSAFPPRWLDAIWLLLLLGTGATWWLGEDGRGGFGVALFILAIAAVKGGLVISEFMALRGVRRLWPLALVGWLLLVLAANLAAYWKGI